MGGGDQRECSEIQGHRLGQQKGDSYLLGNGVANDDVAFWDVPGHSGRVGSEVSDCHIHRRRRPVYGRQCVNRLPGSTPRLALVTPHLLPFYSPARTKPRSQLTSRRTVGLRYGERGISEAMVPTESAGRHPGIRLTFRRGSWRWQELGGEGGGGQGLARKHKRAAALPAPHTPQQPQNPPFPLPCPPPQHPGALSSRLCSAHTHLRRSSRWVRPRGAARCPEGGPSRTPWRCPYPIPARARPGGQRGTELRAESGGVAGAGRGAPEPPELRPAAQSVREQGAVPSRPGSWPGSPGREAVRLPPPAPAARCDRPGAPAAVFCRAGLGRSAAARPGRAGPPRPAGVLAAVITAPPTRFFRGSSHDPLIGGL